MSREIFNWERLVVKPLKLSNCLVIVFLLGLLTFFMVRHEMLIRLNLSFFIPVTEAQIQNKQRLRQWTRPQKLEVKMQFLENDIFRADLDKSILFDRAQPINIQISTDVGIKGTTQSLLY